MKKFIRHLAGGVAVACATLSPLAQASAVQVIDFESPSLTGLYFAGDSFTQGSFRMTIDYDAGIVDGAAALGGSAPTGNATQFYSQLNAGKLIVERSDGGLFDLISFDAAFLPLSPAASGLSVMVAWGVYADNSKYGVAWLFGDSGTSNFPFTHYGDPIDFATFNQVKSLEFQTCGYDGNFYCDPARGNNGQFAIDNISVAVPEPTTVAMLTLGLLGLALRSRRATR